MTIMYTIAGVKLPSIFTDVTNIKILRWIKEHVEPEKCRKIGNSYDPQIEFLNFPIGSNALAGQLVSLVTVTDQDPGDGDKAVVRIMEGNEDALFTLDSRRGVHVVRLAGRARLDREKAEQHLLTVMVEDQGTPPRSSTATLRVKITSKLDKAEYAGIEIYLFLPFQAILQHVLSRIKH